MDRNSTYLGQTFTLNLDELIRFLMVRGQRSPWPTLFSCIWKPDFTKGNFFPFSTNVYLDQNIDWSDFDFQSSMIPIQYYSVQAGGGKKRYDIKGCLKKKCYFCHKKGYSFALIFLENNRKWINEEYNGINRSLE